MADLARKRSPEDCKGGPKLKDDRCACGQHTKHTAALRYHKCG